MAAIEEEGMTLPRRVLPNTTYSVTTGFALAQSRGKVWSWSSPTTCTSA